MKHREEGAKKRRKKKKIKKKRKEEDKERGKRSRACAERQRRLRRSLSQCHQTLSPSLAPLQRRDQCPFFVSRVENSSATHLTEKEQCRPSEVLESLARKKQACEGHTPVFFRFDGLTTARIEHRRVPKRAPLQLPLACAAATRKQSRKEKTARTMIGSREEGRRRRRERKRMRCFGVEEKMKNSAPFEKNQLIFFPVLLLLLLLFNWARVPTRRACPLPFPPHSFLKKSLNLQL